MKITDSNIPFKSKLKLINTKQFNTKVNITPLLKKADYPWTIETLAKGKFLYTDRLMDCIAIFLTNGVSSLLAHLGIRNKEKAKRDNVKEFDIENIEKILNEQIDLKDTKIHGIIFGGMQLEESPSSGNTFQLNQIKGLFEKYKIPYSTIAARKNIHFFGKYSLLYNQFEDTLFITNSHFDSEGINGKSNHKEMELNYDNKVDYNIYEKSYNEQGLLFYKKKRVRTSVEEYFNSQFYQVNLNELDTFG